MTLLSLEILKLEAEEKALNRLIRSHVDNSALLNRRAVVLVILDHLRIEQARHQPAIPTIQEEDLTFDEFVMKHRLRIVVHERSSGNHRDMRYYADFHDAGFKDSPESNSYHYHYGNGPDPETAIKHFAEKIQGKVLCVRAMEIMVPFQFRINRTEPC